MNTRSLRISQRLRVPLLLCATLLINACHFSAGVPGRSNPDSVALETEKPNDSTILPPIFADPVVIPLAAVKGTFDLMTVDPKGQRLFLSAQDNHTLEIIDIAHRRLLHSIPNLNEPKWVVYRPEKNALYVATGGDGKVTEFNDRDYTIRHVFSFREKCNNLRFDTATGQLLVGVGKTFGALGIIDTKTNRIVGEVPLSDYPKQFEIDGNLVYINIPSKHLIDIVDRTAKKVVTDWIFNEPGQNIAMALDKEHQRLFIASDSGKLIVYSIQTGSPITTVDISKEADGLYYDEKRKNIYISAGEGFFDVIKQKDSDHYQNIAQITTLKGAATCLYSPALDLLFLPLPQTGTSRAAVEIFKPID